MATAAELKRHAKAFRKLADLLEVYAPVADQLDKVLQGMKSPGDKAADIASSLPNHAGQIPSPKGEFGTSSVGTA